LLQADLNGDSYFEDQALDLDVENPLGHYTENLSAKSFQLREFSAGLFYDWHNAPQKQYIVYLLGDVKVTTSKDEVRIFSAGDILLANDLKGKGHTTETLTDGRSVVIVV